uniref:Uncharacterized protein n=1 Tax=Rousettus aegyptiacus TaxID=9407 RepID=A0A7J8H1D5_ROUAE|nr:hypothetical protein HJG63_011350 [Rousettus aegyptiacus]
MFITRTKKEISNNTKQQNRTHDSFPDLRNEHHEMCTPWYMILPDGIHLLLFLPPALQPSLPLSHITHLFIYLYVSLYNSDYVYSYYTGFSTIYCKHYPKPSSLYLWYYYYCRCHYYYYYYFTLFQHLLNQIQGHFSSLLENCLTNEPSFLERKKR